MRAARRSYRRHGRGSSAARRARTTSRSWRKYHSAAISVPRCSATSNDFSSDSLASEVVPAEQVGHEEEVTARRDREELREALHDPEDDGVESGQRDGMLRRPLPRTLAVDAASSGGTSARVSTPFTCASARRSASSRSTSSVTASASVRPVPPLARVSVPSTRTPAATTTVVRLALVASAERESKLASTSTAAPGRGRERAADRHPDRPHSVGDDAVEAGAVTRREVADQHETAAEHGHGDDATYRGTGVASTPFGSCDWWMWRTATSAPLDGVADGEVVGGDDRVALRAEIAGPAVEGGEIGGHDRGGHHGDDQRGGSERKRAGGAAEHGESFPKAARGRVDDDRGSTGKEEEGKGGAERATSTSVVGDFLVVGTDDFESDDFLAAVARGRGRRIGLRIGLRRTSNRTSRTCPTSPRSSLPSDEPSERRSGSAWPRCGCRCGGSPSP